MLKKRTHNSTFILKEVIKKCTSPVFLQLFPQTTAEHGQSARQYCHDFATWNHALGFPTVSFQFWKMKENYFIIVSNSSDSVMVG